MYGAARISQSQCLRKFYLTMISSTSLPGGNQVDGLPPVSSKGFNFNEQKGFAKKLPKLVPLAHVQPFGLTDFAGTDYP